MVFFFPLFPPIRTRFPPFSSVLFFPFLFGAGGFFFFLDGDLA